MRLDKYLHENGMTESRTQASELVKQGAVKVNGKIVNKASFNIEEYDDVAVDTSAICPYVSRGGIKLAFALDSFSIDVNGMICLDIGASTGGFTDCLLRRGAKKVYAVDSGTSQLHHKLRADDRVISLENKNARYLSKFDIGELADIVVMDVSFISQTKLYPSLISLIKNDGVLVSLIKPQFEVGKSGLDKGGIVKDEKKRLSAVKAVIESARLYGLNCINTVQSPIKGGDGNTEYLSFFIFRGKD